MVHPKMKMYLVTLVLFKILWNQTPMDPSDFFCMDKKIYIFRSPFRGLDFLSASLHVLTFMYVYDGLKTILN